MRYTNLQDGTDEEEIELVLAGETTNGDHPTPQQRTDGYQHVDNVLEQSYVAAQRQQNWYMCLTHHGCLWRSPGEQTTMNNRPGVMSGRFTCPGTPTPTATGYP